MFDPLPLVLDVIYGRPQCVSLQYVSLQCVSLNAHSIEQCAEMICDIIRSCIATYTVYFHVAV